MAPSTQFLDKKKANQADTAFAGASPTFLSGTTLVRGVDNHLRRRRASRSARSPWGAVRRAGTASTDAGGDSPGKLTVGAFRYLTTAASRAAAVPTSSATGTDPRAGLAGHDGARDRWRARKRRGRRGSRDARRARGHHERRRRIAVALALRDDDGVKLEQDVGQREFQFRVNLFHFGRRRSITGQDSRRVHQFEGRREK